MRPDGYGYRARIGLVYINTSVIMEPECCAMAPEGVSFHTARIPLGQVTVENLSRLASQQAENMLEATKLLAAAPLHSIVFSCTSGSFIGGKGYDDTIIARMHEVSGGIPCTTTSTAVLKGLRAFGARRIAVAAPYTRPVTDRAVSYLQQNGFDVVASETMGLDDDVEIGRVPPEQVYEMVRRLDRPEADAIFISCTGLRTVAVLEDLERDLGKPVISAIQASFWDGLRLAGVRDKIAHYGRLLEL